MIHWLTINNHPSNPEQPIHLFGRRDGEELWVPMEPGDHWLVVYLPTPSDKHKKVYSYKTIVYITMIIYIYKTIAGWWFQPL